MFPLPAQTLEFEDYKNDTQYEEYEEYQDHFEFAERDGGETWAGEVNPGLQSESYPQKHFVTETAEGIRTVSVLLGL